MSGIASDKSSRASKLEQRKKRRLSKRQTAIIKDSKKEPNKSKDSLILGGADDPASLKKPTDIIDFIGDNVEDEVDE